MSTTPSSPKKHTFAGIFMVVSGLFLFAIQDVIIKLFSDTYPVLELVFIRSVTGILVFITVFATMGKLSSLRVHRKWPILIKGLFAFTSYICYYLAIAGLPLAETATITFFAPVLVTALSALFFKEQVGIHRWAAVLAGFFAIVLIIGPKGHFNNPAIILALAAAFSYAGTILCTRLLDPRDSAATTAFYITVVYLICSAIGSGIILFIDPNPTTTDQSLLFLIRPWSSPSHLDQWLIISTAVIAAIGFYCLTQAYLIAEFSSVAPFEYSYILWSVIFGYIFWNDLPGVSGIVGIVLLIVSNLYILHRERVRNKT